MAEPNEIADGEKTVAPNSNTDATKSELPNVESPPLSPAETLAEPVLDAQMNPQTASSPRSAAEPAAARVTTPHIRIPSLKIPAVKIPHVAMPTARLSRRFRRRAALAAIVMLAAGFGAAIGAVATRAPAAPPLQRDAALIEENHALQRSVARLTKDLGGLKASIEAAGRDNKAQLAKATEKLGERIDKAMEVTGSIGKQPAAAPPPAVAEKTDPAPLPQPRPAIVQGWSVREARNGRVYVESRGELFIAAPGIPLPGLGRIEAIRREGDKLVVVTSKGLITDNRASAAIPARPGFASPYWRPY